MSFFTEFFFPLLKILLRTGYFSLEAGGLENIPRRGKSVFVCNHSGWFTLDTFFVGMVMMEKGGIDPQHLPYGIAQDILCKIPLLKSLFSLEHSFVPSSWLKSPESMPEGVQSIGIYPEGAEGNCKPFWQAYRMAPWKTGFVRYALKRRAKIVPIAIVGGEESFPSLWVTEKLRAFFGTKFPVPALPFPLPAKWKITFMKPIDLRTLLGLRRHCHFCGLQRLSSRPHRHCRHPRAKRKISQPVCPRI